jgi:hypothetical protein
MNQYVKDIFTKSLKFRWLTLENSGVDRKIKYKLAVNRNQEQKVDLHSFCLRFIVVIALDEKSNSSGFIKYMEKDSDINQFPFMFTLSEMEMKNGFNITTEGIKSFNSDKLKVTNI